MKKQVLIVLAGLTWASTAPAANFSWLGGVSSDWTNPGNWWNHVTGPTATPPAAGDLAVIGFPIAGFDANPRPSINSVLYTAASPLGWLGMDWWNETGGNAPENAALTIATGGGLEVNNTWMNVGGQETATITINGGYLRSWTQVNMGMTAGGTSQVNLDAGFLYTPTLLFGPGIANIDLEPGAFLYLAGDQTASAATWIGAGKITGHGTPLVTYDLTTLPGFTTLYTEVPEPASMMILLLGLGVGGVVRRRTR
jgi:hypothetical protein